MNFFFLKAFHFGSKLFINRPSSATTHVLGCPRRLLFFLIFTHFFLNRHQQLFHTELYITIKALFSSFQNWKSGALQFHFLSLVRVPCRSCLQAQSYYLSSEHLFPHCWRQPTCRPLQLHTINSITETHFHGAHRKYHISVSVLSQMLWRLISTQTSILLRLHTVPRWTWNIYYGCHLLLSLSRTPNATHISSTKAFFIFDLCTISCSIGVSSISKPNTTPSRSPKPTILYSSPLVVQTQVLVDGAGLF